jgi:hypothetical protein
VGRAARTWHEYQTSPLAALKTALGVGTEVELCLGPRSMKPKSATVLSGGFKETKWKGVGLVVGVLVAVAALIFAWVTLRKRLLEA